MAKKQEDTNVCKPMNEYIKKIQNSLVMVHTNNTTSDETVGL